MNAHQRRVAFRRLKLDWPVGTLVTHWYERGEFVVAGYTRDLMSVDVAVADVKRQFPFGFCFKPHQMQRVPPKSVVIEVSEEVWRVVKQMSEAPARCPSQARPATRSDLK